MTTVLDAFVAEADQVRTNRVRSDPGWLSEARQKGLERFQALGFPSTRDEEWRFTSVAPITESGFALAKNGASALDPAALAPFRLPGDLAATLVFVNGRYLAAASDVDRLPRGVRVESLAQAVSRPTANGLERHLTRVAQADRQAFAALNTAFLVDGAFVHVPDSTTIEDPIHLLFVSVGEGRRTMAQPRVLIVMGAGSRATIVETYGAVEPGVSQTERYFTNAVTEIAAGEHAALDHYKVQRESLTSVHVGGTYVRAERDADVACHSIALGGALVRNDVVVVLDGEGAKCTLSGLYLADGTRLVDNHTTIDHAKPHCASREIYKGILADRARAVFNGKIVVRPDAQKTDAKQTNKALLLSDSAQIDTKPQLEIFANDVRCTHGAAIGQMDDEAIFYLRARGLSEVEARRLLIRAFVGDVLSQMPLEPLRASIDRLVERIPGLTS